MTVLQIVWRNAALILFSQVLYECDIHVPPAQAEVPEAVVPDPRFSPGQVYPDGSRGRDNLWIPMPTPDADPGSTEMTGKHNWTLLLRIGTSVGYPRLSLTSVQGLCHIRPL